MPRRLISFLLISIFALDHAAMFVNAFDIGSQAPPGAETVCGCTCCGDVCPMGASCCCYGPEKKNEPDSQPVRLVENSCSPNPFDLHVYSLFFSSVKWIGPQVVTTPCAYTAPVFYEQNQSPALSRPVKPLTPPPNA